MTTTNTDMSAIDQAIKAAQARKAKKDSTQSSDSETIANEASKAERKVAREVEKHKRDEERAAKKAAKLAAKPKKEPKVAKKNPKAHLVKLEKAAASLPKIENKRLVEVFASLQTQFDSTELSLLSAHLQYYVRSIATISATNAKKVEVGTKVKIVSGDPRYVGQEGIVNKSQRIRCYVELASGKVAYCFISDVVSVESSDVVDESTDEVDEVVDSTGTDG